MHTAGQVSLSTVQWQICHMRLCSVLPERMKNLPSFWRKHNYLVCKKDGSHIMLGFFKQGKVFMFRFSLPVSSAAPQYWIPPVICDLRRLRILICDPPPPSTRSLPAAAMMSLWCNLKVLVLPMFSFISVSSLPQIRNHKCPVAKVVL